jgi:hypothetical protein
MTCYCYACAGPKTVREAFFHDPAVFAIPEYVCPRCLDRSCQGADDHRNDCAPQMSWLLRLDAPNASRLFAALLGAAGFFGLAITWLWPFAACLAVAVIIWMVASWNQEYRDA